MDIRRAPRLPTGEAYGTEVPAVREGVKRKEEGDFWFRVKNTGADALSDLTLIAEIADERILKDIFWDKASPSGGSRLVELLLTLMPAGTRKLGKEEDDVQSCWLR